MSFVAKKCENVEEWKTNSRHIIAISLKYGEKNNANEIK